MSPLDPLHDVPSWLTAGGRIEVIRVWQFGSHHLVDFSFKVDTRTSYWRCQLTELAHLLGEQDVKLPVLVWASAKDIPAELLHLPWVLPGDETQLGQSLGTE